MEEKIKIGISSCLLGEKVRYDGGHKLDHYLRDTLGRFVEWVPVCPEVESGLPVPREPMRLVGTPESPRLVTVRTGMDHTSHMLGRPAARRTRRRGPLRIHFQEQVSELGHAWGEGVRCFGSPPFVRSSASSRAPL